MKPTFAELNNETFKEIAADRKKDIENASDAPLRKTYPLNELAKKLHPSRQYMKVAEVEQLAFDTKRYRLVPNPERGTTQCAVFKAGQYLNVYEDIDGMKVNRAYSISSSPKDAKEGFYEITVKTVNGGLVSNYIFDNWKVGDEVTVSGPSGHFTYSLLRDAKTVVGIAGGSGITPFLSMAKAIAAGKEPFNLVLLYGSRKADAILYKEAFDELEKLSDKIKVVHVLSDEDVEGYEHGFVTADIITKYAPKDEPYSVFLCGPQAMYRFADKELEKLNLERKYIRHELFGEVHDPNTLEGYPGTDQETVKITVNIRDTSKTVTGKATDTILQTLEKNGIAVPTRCRSGECGFCHSRLCSGKVYVPSSVDGRRLADLKYGYIHPCVTFPLSDIEIEVPADK